MDFYFVKDGLVNGEEGVFAVPCGGGDDPPQPDGWYYLPPDYEDGIGPFATKEEAEEASKEDSD